MPHFSYSEARATCLVERLGLLNANQQALTELSAAVLAKASQVIPPKAMTVSANHNLQYLDLQYLHSSETCPRKIHSFIEL